MGSSLEAYAKRRWRSFSGTFGRKLREDERKKCSTLLQKIYRYCLLMGKRAEEKLFWSTQHGQNCAANSHCCVCCTTLSWRMDDTLTAFSHDQLYTALIIITRSESNTRYTVSDTVILPPTGVTHTVNVAYHTGQLRI